MVGFFKNNDNKVSWLLENVWYPENFDKNYIGKMNLDSNSTIELTKTGTVPVYLSHIKSKTTPKVSSVDITLTDKEDAIQAIFWYNTGCFDSSNYQNGLIGNKYRDDLKRTLNSCKSSNGKVIVFMPGNLVGKEWEFRYLLNSVSKMVDETDFADENSLNKEIRRIYFGLKKRKEKIINDIKFALSNGAEEIILMKGAEEFNVYKQTGLDILQEIVDYIADPRVKYVSEGTTAKVNLIKVNGQKSIYNVIELKSDLNSKSENPAIMEEKGKYLYKDSADVSFICGGNYTASLGNTNEFFPSGQLMFFNAVRGKNPKFMFNQGNVFKIYPESDHNITVVKGGQGVFEENEVLLNKTYLENKKLRQLGEVAITLIEEKQNEIARKPIVFPTKKANTSKIEQQTDEEFSR